MHCFSEFRLHSVFYGLWNSFLPNSLLQCFFWSKINCMYWLFQYNANVNLNACAVYVYVIFNSIITFFFLFIGQCPYTDTYTTLASDEFEPNNIQLIEKRRINQIKKENEMKLLYSYESIFFPSNAKRDAMVVNIEYKATSIEPFIC